MPELYNQVKSANSRFVPQFIGSNAEELKNVGDTLDQRYRGNRDLSDKLAIELANDEVHPLDQHIIDKLHSSLYNTLDEVASSKENFENSTGIIAGEAKKIFTDKGRIAALNNHKKYQEYLDLKSKAGRDAVDFTPAFTGSFNADGSINHFQHRLEKRLDYDKQKEQYFNQMEAGLTEKYGKDVAQGMLKSITSGGIPDSRITNYLNSAFNRHKGTAEYSQEAELIKQEAGNKGIDLPQSAIDEGIKQSILDVGRERVYGIHKEDLHNIPEWAGKGSAVNENPYGGTDIGVPILNAFTPLQSTKEQGVTKDVNGKYFKTSPGSQLTGTDTWGNPHYEPKIEEVDPTNPNKEGTTANQLAYINKSFGTNISHDQYETAYENAKNNMKLLAPKTYDIAPEKRGEEDAKLKGDIFAKPILVSGTGQLTSAGANDFPLDKSKGLKVYSRSIVPVVGNPNFKGGGMEVTIVSEKDGKSINAVVPINNEFTKGTEVLGDIAANSINQGYDSPNYKKGKETSIPGNNHQFVINTITSPKELLGEPYQPGEGHPNKTVVRMGVKLPKSGGISHNPDDVDNPFLKALISHAYTYEDYSTIYYEYLKTGPFKNLLGTGKTEAALDLKHFVPED